MHCRDGEQGEQRPENDYGVAELPDRQAEHVLVP